jgi:hypothetical protein
MNSKPAPVCDPARYAAIYARVSSKEQEKDGFSIPAQLKLLKDYGRRRVSRWRRNMSTLKPPSRPAAPASARW